MPLGNITMEFVWRMVMVFVRIMKRQLVTTSLQLTRGILMHSVTMEGVWRMDVVFIRIMKRQCVTTTLRQTRDMLWHRNAMEFVSWSWCSSELGSGSALLQAFCQPGQC